MDDNQARARRIPAPHPPAYDVSVSPPYPRIVSSRVSDETYKRARNLAKRQDKPLAQVIRDALNALVGVTDDHSGEEPIVKGPDPLIEATTVPERNPIKAQMLQHAPASNREVQRESARPGESQAIKSRRIVRCTCRQPQGNIVCIGCGKPR